jgi:hypothetical protein
MATLFALGPCSGSHISLPRLLGLERRVVYFRFLRAAAKWSAQVCGNRTSPDSHQHDSRCEQHKDR